MDHRLVAIRKLIRADAWKILDHVYSEHIGQGQFDVDDVMYSIMNGCITKKQKDSVKAALDGYYYTINGPAQNGLGIESQGKIVDLGNGRLYLIFNAYKCKEN